MLLPRIFGENVFDDWFTFPQLPDFDHMAGKLYGTRADRMMKMDVQEHEDHYDVDIDLPGFKKDEITLELQNGYLQVSAAKELKQEKETEGKMLHQERYTGAMQRSFYVGETLTEEDIQAKFEDGVLSLTVPKKEKPEMPEKKTIMIAG